MVDPHRWHESVERYTPNGVVGRLLLAVPLGPIGVYVLLGSVGVVVSFGLLWLPIAVALAGAGLAATLLTIAMLWPIYLSLIGQLDSTRNYSPTATDSDSKLEDNQERPINVLKRRYANGKISQEQFEQQVETLLGTDMRMDRRSAPDERDHQTTAEEFVYETELN